MRFLIKIILILLLFSAPTVSYGNNIYWAPAKNKVWRIGYTQSGVNIPIFNKALKGFIQQLIKDGYFPSLSPAVFKNTDNKKIWGIISNISNGEIKFVKNAFLDQHWKDTDYTLSKKQANKCIKKYNLDVVLVMGTLAAQKCVIRNTNTIFIIMGASNVYKSGITSGQTYSGFDNVFATIDPCIYKQQIKVFHSIIGFNKLGIVFKDTIRDRTYAGIDDIEDMSKVLNFDVVTCFSDPENLNIEEAEDDLEECYKHLAKLVDAVYVTAHRALLYHKYAYRMALPFLKNKIPTFVQSDPKLVKHGFLISMIAKEPGKDEGAFTAKQFEKILNGAVPGKLKMKFHEKTSLFINKKVAKIIGIKIPKSILKIADKVYERIYYEE